MARIAGWVEASDDRWLHHGYRSRRIGNAERRRRRCRRRSLRAVCRVRVEQLA